MKAKVLNNNQVIQVEPDTYTIPPEEANTWYDVIPSPWRAIWDGLTDDTRTGEEKLASVYLDNWNYTVDPAGLQFAYEYIPAYANGQAMYVSGGELLEGNVVYEVIPAAPILTHRLGDLAAYRYEQEIGGVNFTGMKIASDRASQAMLTAARLKAIVDPAVIIDWKTEAGFVQLGKPAIEAISDAVSYHVEFCFSREMFHHENMAQIIDAYKLMSYDFTTGWTTTWVDP